MNNTITINFGENIYNIHIDKSNIITGQKKYIYKFMSVIHKLFPDSGIVDKNGTLISNMNLLTNISLPLLYHTNQPPQIIEEKVYALMHRLNFNYILTDFPETLTLEDKKKISIVRALLRSPAALLIYEISDINLYLLNKILEKLLTFNIFIVCSTEIKNIYVSLGNTNIIDL